MMLFVVIGCGDADSDESSDAATDADADADADTDGDTDTDTDGDGDSDGDVDTGDSDSADFCETVSSDAQLEPVYLAFAFDVSGSMGEGDYPWHDRTLKWDPVVAATTAFFGDTGSLGLFASMVFFPSHDEDRCEDASYVTPDVPFTRLPSPLFADALTAIGEEEWEGGTPTLHVMNGVLQFVQESRDAVAGKYAIVLVTDGYPQGCDDNDIASVTAVAEDAAEEGIFTYVIGVNNPPLPDAPDTVSNLTQIAVGGGTQAAFIIDTGNPEQTTADFNAVIDGIRDAAFSCDVAIPAPPENRQFDKQRVQIAASVDGEPVVFDYDADCVAPFAWHYDDPDAPSRIMLCESTCEAIRAQPQPDFTVRFACTDLIFIE